MLRNSILLLVVLICACCESVTSAAKADMSDVKVTKNTMKKLCEMPEFQEALAADEELEPAAVVYEVMSRRLEGMESTIKELEKKLETVPTEKEIESIAAALRLELMEHVDDRINVITSEMEASVEKILKNLMSNLASLGYEYGYGLQTTPTPTTTTETPYKDCSYLAGQGFTTGVHELNLMGEILEAYCDIREDDFAWLVIQKRVDGEVDFFRGWDEYKKGFGDLMGSFYLGNELIHKITSMRPHMLRIEVTDMQGDTGFAEYSNFSISSAEFNYKLHFDKFLGGVIGNGLKSAKGSEFSTYDSDHDGSQLYSCARLHKGGFWYDRCGSANPNGVYADSTASLFNWQNIFWYPWKRDLRGLKSVEMKIQPEL